MRPLDIVRDSHSHSRCSTVSLPLRQLVHKGFISFPILYKWLFRPRCPVCRPIKTDSCCLLMLSSLAALPCWGTSMRALECLQSLPDFQRTMCFLSIQSPNARLTTLYGRPSMGSVPVNGVSVPFFASSSVLSLPRCFHAPAPTPVELSSFLLVYWAMPWIQEPT